MLHVKLWKRYIFYIIGIQLVVFMLFAINNYYLTNEEIIEEHLLDDPCHKASLGKKENRIAATNYVTGNDIGLKEFL